MSKQKVKYLECEKLKEVSEESNKIGAFLDWLIHEKQITLGQYKDTECLQCGDEVEQICPLHLTIEDLLAEYFDIDMDKVEKERRQILKEIQKG